MTKTANKLTKRKKKCFEIKLEEKSADKALTKRLYETDNAHFAL